MWVSTIVSKHFIIQSSNLSEHYKLPSYKLYRFSWVLNSFIEILAHTVFELHFDILKLFKAEHNWYILYYFGDVWIWEMECFYSWLLRREIWKHLQITFCGYSLSNMHYYYFLICLILLQHVHYLKLVRRIYSPFSPTKEFFQCQIELILCKHTNLIRKFWNDLITPWKVTPSDARNL